MRIRAFGRRPYITLGSEHDGWTDDSAREERDRIVSAVRSGVWTPPEDVDALEAFLSADGLMPKLAGISGLLRAVSVALGDVERHPKADPDEVAEVRTALYDLEDRISLARVRMHPLSVPMNERLAA